MKIGVGENYGEYIKGKKLIIIQGSIESPFFLNELPFMSRFYDEICIIDLSGKREKGLKIQEHYGFIYRGCKPNIKRIFTKSFFLWIIQKYVRDEIKKAFSISIKGIKKLGYIIFYGISYMGCKKYIDEEIEKSNGIVDIYAYWLSRPAFIASIYKNNAKVRSVFARAHGYDLYLERNSMNYLPFRKLIDSCLDTIYFISQNGKVYYESRYLQEGIELKAKRKISRLGVYEAEKKNPEQNPKRWIIASCSSMISIKRLDLIVDVIAELKEQNVKWIHFGDGELKEKVQERCDEKLEKENYSLYGFVDNKRLLEIYYKEGINLFINLSDSEGIPVSIMEAMAFRIPVIARDVGGMSEIVNNKNGLLLKSFQKEEMAKEIKNFLNELENNRDKYQEMCNGAYTTWENMYNANDNYTQFFEDVCKGANE